jgi:hypothetical protein
MAFSQGVRFTISADSSNVQREFSKMQQMAQTTGKQMDAAFVKAQQAVIQSIANQRERIDYARGNTLTKIGVVTKQIRTDEQTMAKLEQGSVTWLKAKERIEGNVAHLKMLQLKSQKEILANTPKPTAASGGATDPKGALSGLGEGLVKRLIWLGAGAAVSGIIGIARSYFSNKAQIAGAQEDSSAAGLASTQARFAAVGGLRGQLTQGQTSLRGMTAARDFQQNHINDLKSGISGLTTAVSPESMKILADAESKLIAMNGELQKQHDTNALIQRDIDQHSASLDGENKKVSELVALNNSRQLSELNISLVERQRLQELYDRDVAEKRILKGSVEERSRLLELDKQNLQVLNLMNQAKAKLQSVYQSVSDDAAGGRTFSNGTKRPRSETERLAQRAQMFRARARNLILEGATGGGAGSSIASARRDEMSAANRLADASSSVGPPDGATDLSSLPAKVENTNSILSAIRASLEVSLVN